MATQTTNLHLTKPDGTEKVNIATINGNMDIIDTYAGTATSNLNNVRIATTLTSPTTLSELQSSIYAVANAMAQGEVKAIRFMATANFETIARYTPYEGLLLCNFVDGTRHDFSVALYNGNANQTIIGMNNGVWYYKEVSNPLFKDVSHNSSSTKVTNLNDLQCGTWGRALLAAAVSPTGSDATVNYIRVGNTVEYSGIFCYSEYGNICAYNNCGNGTYGGWKQLALDSKLLLSQITSFQAIEDTGHNLLILRGNYEGTGNYLQLITNSNTKQLQIAKSVSGTETTNTTLYDGTITKIFTGPANNYDKTQSFTLTEAYTNFRYIWIQTQTNSQWYTQIIPTDYIVNDRDITFFAQAAAGYGQISSWNYQCACDIRFTNTTTFVQGCSYNNINWLIKVIAIYGIGRK